MDTDGGVSHLQWIASQLQNYPMDEERARQLLAELDSSRALLRNEAPTLGFDDQPADFRAVQLGEKPHV